MAEASEKQTLGVLVVEDDASARQVSTFNLQRAGYTVDEATSGDDALARFDAGKHGVVVTDLRMPGMHGLDLLGQLMKRSPTTPVIVVTAFSDVDTAVRAMKAGAYDFIGKPFSKDQLLLTVARAAERHALKGEVEKLKRALGVERPIIAESGAMTEVLSLTDRVANADSTVLITGETGTGKELVARRIHARSARRDGPFVSINCAAIPTELLESELFGHRRGAFTGAVRDRAGKFRRAQGGTLLLDEVAELPLELQGKLLRALQERKIDVVGTDEPVDIDVRIIAATHHDLSQRVANGALREDLFYRLQVVEISLPPLRERPEDIPLLAQHFVRTHAGDRELVLPSELVDELASREWPGNVRQLENACERLVVLCPGDVLRAEDLPPARHAQSERASGSGEWPPLPPDGLDLVDLEKRVIERVLQLKRGNVSQAASYLGVPRHILAYRMSKYDIRRGGK